MYPAWIAPNQKPRQPTPNRNRKQERLPANPQLVSKGQFQRPTQQKPAVVPQPPKQIQPISRPEYSKPFHEKKNLIATQGVGDRGNQEKTKLSALEQQDLKEILFEIGRLLLMTQIYKSSHPIVQEKLSNLSLLMIKIANKYGRIVLSNREDVVFLNGYQEKVSRGPLLKLKDTLKHLKVASFEFEKGITEQEIGTFFDLIAIQRREKDPVDIKERLKIMGLGHIKQIFLQYVEVEDIPQDVPKPKNVIEGTKHGIYLKEEQVISDFLKGKVTKLPKKLNTFILSHPKLAAMVLVKMIDEYESQNLDSFAAFQAYVQSLSHYMARLSRLIKDPDKIEKTLKKLEKHLVVRLKALKKDRKYINEARQQIKDALSWVGVEQLLAHYQKAKENLSDKEQEIIEAIEKRKVPSVRELKNRLIEQGVFESKLSSYLNKPTD